MCEENEKEMSRVILIVINQSCEDLAYIYIAQLFLYYT